MERLLSSINPDMGNSKAPGPSKANGTASPRTSSLSLPSQTSPQRSKSSSSSTSSSSAKCHKPPSPVDLEVSKSKSESPLRQSPSESRPSDRIPGQWTKSPNTSPKLPSASLPSPLAASSPLIASPMAPFPFPMAPPVSGMPGLPHPAGPCLDPACKEPSCATLKQLQAMEYMRSSYALGSVRMPATPFPMMPGFPFPSLPGLPGFSPVQGFGFPPLANSAAPIVCRWMDGSQSCGKEFRTAEELMEHLNKDHTGSPKTPTTSSQEQQDVLKVFQDAQERALQSISSAHMMPSALASLQARSTQLASGSVLPPRSSPLASSTSVTSASDSLRFHPYGKQAPGIGQLPPGIPPSYLSLGLPPTTRNPYGLPL